jgi:hypothetical protein
MRRSARGMTHTRCRIFPSAIGTKAPTAPSLPVGGGCGKGLKTAERNLFAPVPVPSPSQVGPARFAPPNERPGQARVGWGRKREGLASAQPDVGSLLGVGA